MTDLLIIYPNVPSRTLMHDLLNFEDLAHNALSVNSASKIDEMALLRHRICKNLSVEIALSNPSENFYLVKFFSGTNHGGPYSREWMQDVMYVL